MKPVPMMAVCKPGGVHCVTIAPLFDGDMFVLSFRCSKTVWLATWLPMGFPSIIENKAAVMKPKQHRVRDAANILGAALPSVHARPITRVSDPMMLVFYDVVAYCNSVDYSYGLVELDGLVIDVETLVLRVLTWIKTGLTLMAKVIHVFTNKVPTLTVTSPELLTAQKLTPTPRERNIQSASV